MKKYIAVTALSLSLIILSLILGNKIDIDLSETAEIGLFTQLFDQVRLF